MVQTTHSVVKGVPFRARSRRSPFAVLRRTRSHNASETAGVAPTTLRAARIETLWILSVVGYTVLRFVIAWGAFGDHGANVWIFGFIDIATAVPYAKAVAMVCRRAAAFEWRRLPMPIGVALVSFFAPYAYLWFSAGSMPSGVRVGLAICVAVLAVAATVGVVTKVRKLRGADVIDLAEQSDPADSADEIVIDLTREETRVYTRSRIAS